MIASLRIMTRLSPLQTLTNKGINFNPSVQKNLLAYAVNKQQNKEVDEEEEKKRDDSSSTNTIPVAIFKSNKLSHLDKK